MPNRLITALLLLLLAACAPAQSPAPSQPTQPPEAVAAPQAKPAPDAQPAPDALTQASGEVDYGCKVDADCAVKNVGNCCGYYPACVNADSPTFPEQVQQRCAAEGASSICGFREISACQCVASRCEAAPDASASLKLD